MEMKFSKDEIAGLVRGIVAETVEQLGIDREWLGGRLMFSEAELAAMIGVPRHVLADHRRRLQAENGQSIGRQIGKSLHYNRDEALELVGMENGNVPRGEDD